MSRDLYGMGDRVRSLSAPGASPMARNLVLWLGAWSVAPLALVATVSVALVDTVIGVSALGGGSRDALRLFLYGVSHLAVAASPIGVIALVTVGILVRLERARGGLGRRAAGVLAWGALTALVVVTSREVFDGAWIARQSWVLGARLGWYAVGVVGSLAAVRLVARFSLREHDGRSHLWHLIWCAAFLGIGVGLQVVDATVLTGGYPGPHRLVAVLAVSFHLLAWVTALGALDENAPRSALVGLASLAVLAVAGTLGALALRTAPDVHRLRAALHRPAFAVTGKVVGLVERHVLDRLRPLDEMRGDDAAAALVRAAFALPGGPLPAREAKRWNVVLITVDTLRHDEVGFAGSTDSRTPDLDRFARDAWVFERAYTPYPTSNYAYSAMLTGLYPRWAPARTASDPRLTGPPAASLAEVLKARGWTTAAVTGFNPAGTENPAIFGHTKVGFDLFDPFPKRTEVDADVVTDAALDLIAKRDPSRPFLLWAHYMDPHSPYLAHPGFEGGDDRRSLYRSEIAYTDRQVGRLLEALRAPELAQNTLVWLLADHGESFGEHNTNYHNSNLHDEQVRIPLAVRVPGASGRRVPWLGNLVDLTPTTLGLLGVDDGMPRMGRDLAPLLTGARDPAAWVDFSYSERFARDPRPGRESQRALVYDGLKVIRFAGDPTVEIYDLVADPAELHNVADPVDPRHRRLIGFLDALERHIDEAAGGAPPAQAEEARATADLIIERLGDDQLGNDVSALIDFGLTLLGHRQEYSPEIAAMIGPERMARMRDQLVAVARSVSHDDNARGFALALLTCLPDPALAPMMLEGLAAPSLPVRRAAALWLARQGDDAGRAILRESLSPDDPKWCLSAAPAMARIGERSAVPWLLTLLAESGSGRVLEAVDGLVELDYPDLDLVAREFLSAYLVGMSLPRPQLALARWAAKRPSLGTSLLLLRFAAAPTAEVQAEARRALAHRFTPARLATAMVLMERHILGDEAVRSYELDDAVEHYRAARAGTLELEIEDALLDLKLARLLGATGHPDDGLALLDALVQGSETRPWARGYARALANTLRDGAPVLVDPRRVRLDVALADAPRIPPLARTRFAFTVRIRNAGEHPIPGGVWWSGLRLSCLFRDAQGGVDAPNPSHQLLQSFLPRTGLGPGEEAEMTIMGSTPGAVGSYTPLLLLTARPWLTEDHQIVLELPQVTIVTPQ